MTTPVLEVRSLRKRFGRVEAVRGVTFSAVRGTVTALLGPNGAGKTTTLKLILGFLRPDGGDIRLSAARPGYVPEDPAFFPRLSGRDVLRSGLIASGLPASGPALRDVAGRWAALIGFEAGLLDRPARALSHGNRKKLSYLQSLVLEPDLLLVDEPLAALDPEGIKRCRDLVAALRSAGTTVVLSSHIIAEMEKVCDRVAIMHEGRIVLQDDLAALRAAGRPDGRPFDLEVLFLAATRSG